MPSRTSRAVLIGTWDYEHLPTVPAARHSLERMRALLTGELCGWPADRVTVIDNRATPGDLHDQLIELYSDTDPDGVALFYFVGHGQPDDQDRLCLGLAGSRTDFNRRASTSLRFDDVRGALTGCAAQTKVVMLDCCFAGLAARPQQSLSGAAVLDMVRGAGAYTMAASGAYLPAWFETDTERPQTYFTKYFVDVVEAGIAGQPAGLALDRIFAEAAANLQRDRKPEPTHTARHEAGRTVFARNAAPVERQIDDAAEVARLRKVLADTQAEVAALRAKDLETDRRFRAEPDRDELLDEANASASRTAAAEARQAEVVEALRDAGDAGESADSAPMVDVRARVRDGDPTTLHAALIDAAKRPVADVAKFVEWLLKGDRRADATTVLRWAGRRPAADVAELARALHRTEDGNTAGRQLIRHAARDRPVSEVVELMALLRAMEPDPGSRTVAITVAITVAMSAPARVLAVLDGLRAEGREDDAQTVLRMAGLWDDPKLVKLVQALQQRGSTDDLIALLTASSKSGWRQRGRLRREMRQTSIPEEVWRPLLGGPAPMSVETTSLLGLAVVMGLLAGIGVIPSVARYFVPIATGAWVAYRVRAAFRSPAGLAFVVAGAVVLGFLAGLLLRWIGVAL
jgi:hypothetical protein